MAATHLDRLVTGLRTALEPAQPADRELLDRFIAKRDPDSFEALVRRHGPAVLAACRGVLRNGPDADDAFQATFLTLAQNARRVRTQAVGGWLVVVAHRISCRLLSATRRRVEVESRHEPTPVETPDLSWRESCAILHSELDALPPRYRHPLVLCYLQGLSRDEAARQLGWPPGVLKGRLERGRSRLRARLAKRGLTLSAGLLAAIATPDALAVPARLVQLASDPKAASPGVVGLVGTSRPAVAIWGTTAIIGLVTGLVLALTAGTPTDLGAGDKPSKAPAASISSATAPDLGSVDVKGKVLGPNGKPVATARLFVIDGARRPAPQETTAADGSFAFTLPARGSLNYRFVVAVAPGLGCDWVVVPPFRSAGEVTLRLPEDMPITGRVLDLEGRPVAGARVAVEAIDATSSENLDEFLKEFRGRGHEQSIYMLDKHLLEGAPLAEMLHTTSDSAGRFTIRGIGKERVPGFIVSSPNHAQQAVRVLTRPGHVEPFNPAKQKYQMYGPDLTIALPPTKPVTGVVRDAVTKKPMAGVRVSAQFVAESAFLRRWHAVETTTDEEGRYTLRGTAKAKDTVVLFDTKPGDGYLHYYAKADDTEAFAAVKLDVELQRGIVLEGRVTDKDSGKPVRAHVWYRPLADNDWEEKTPGYEWLAFGSWAEDDTATTGDDGRYRITVLPGRGLLHFQTQDLNPTEYPPARLDPKDKDRGVYSMPFKDMPGLIQFDTGGRGGMYGPESLNAYRVINPKPGDTQVTADQVLWAGKSVKLQVVGPDGKPLTGVQATGLKPMDGFKDVGADARATGLDPEHPRRLLFRQAEEKLFALVTLKGTEPEPVTIKLEPGGTITGRVVGVDGKGVAGVTVEPSFQDHPLGTLLNTEKRYDRGAGPVKTDADGRFRFEGVPPGVRVRLIARRVQDDYWYSNQIMTLKPGEVRELGDWKRE
jgi:RNA polymerase sigma factor (sigma-70 family)